MIAMSGGKAGRVRVPNIREPVHILDMAERLIRTSGKDTQVVIAGLGERKRLPGAVCVGSEDSTRPASTDPKYA